MANLLHPSTDQGSTASMSGHPNWWRTIRVLRTIRPTRSHSTHRTQIWLPRAHPPEIGLVGGITPGSGKRTRVGDSPQDLRRSGVAIQGCRGESRRLAASARWPGHRAPDAGRPQAGSRRSWADRRPQNGNARPFSRKPTADVSYRWGRHRHRAFPCENGAFPC